MTPRMEGEAAKQPFARKSNSKKDNVEEVTMTEIAEQSNNSPVSIADLYNEMEATITIKGGAQNAGVTQRIRTLVDQTFEATGKDKLLLSAMVKIAEKQEGRTKLYNLVRSIAMSKSPQCKYGLLNEDGKVYIVRK